MTTPPVPAADATVEMTPEMIKAAESYLILRSLNGLANLPAQFNWHEFYATIVAASPPAPVPVGDEVVEAVISAMEDDPFPDDIPLLGTSQQSARVRHYASIALAAISSPQPPKGQGAPRE